MQRWIGIGLMIGLAVSLIMTSFPSDAQEPTMANADLLKLQTLIGEEYKRLVADQIIPSYEPPATTADAQFALIHAYLRIMTTQWRSVTTQVQQEQRNAAIAQERNRKLDLTVQQQQQALDALKQGQKPAVGSSEVKPE